MVRFDAELQDQFDQVVPNAAQHSDRFLRTIRKRADEAGVGLEFDVLQPSRKDPRKVLQALLTFGSFSKGRRNYTVQAYADPLGQALQVGYQLSSMELGGNFSYSAMGQAALSAQQRIHNDPNTIRQLNGIMQVFHGSVFLPTLEDLVTATSRAQGSPGFFNA